MVENIDKDNNAKPPPTAITDDEEKDEKPVYIRKIIYLVRHAEAEHNVIEKEAIASLPLGSPMEERERARKNALKSERGKLLTDARLSKHGMIQIERTKSQFQDLLSSNKCVDYEPPDIVLVSPLRRAIQTAIRCFGDDDVDANNDNKTECCTKDKNNSNKTSCYTSSNDGNAAAITTNNKNNSNINTKKATKYIALEVMREKRTGLPCDEHLYANQLRAEYPNVNFDDLVKQRRRRKQVLSAFSSSQSTSSLQEKEEKENDYDYDDRIDGKDEEEIPIGENNTDVQKRAALFLDNYLPYVEGKFVSIVSHKGWLRELRHVLKKRLDSEVENDEYYSVQNKKKRTGKLILDFDEDDWYMKLYDNAELRVAEFIWQQKKQQQPPQIGIDGIPKNENENENDNPTSHVKNHVDERSNANSSSSSQDDNDETCIIHHSASNNSNYNDCSSSGSSIMLPHPSQHYYELISIKSRSLKNAIESMNGKLVYNDQPF